MITTAFSQDLYVDKLKRVLKKIDEQPELKNELCKEYVADVFEFIRKRISDSRQEVVMMFLYNLYQADYRSLYTDLSKIKLCNLNKDASIEERFELLRSLANAIELYFKGDWSAILNQLHNTCTLADAMRDTDEDDRLPFD